MLGSRPSLSLALALLFLSPLLAAACRGGDGSGPSSDPGTTGLGATSTNADDLPPRLPDDAPMRELGVTDMGPHPPLEDRTFEHRGRTYNLRMMVPDKTYDALALPDFAQFVPVGGHLPACRRMVTYSCVVNSHGLRGEREYPRTSSPGRYRIGALGTGVTFGEGVDDPEVYATLLEQSLNEKPPIPRTFDVINFGISSTTMDLAVGTFLKFSTEYEVDAWILALGVNDPLPMFHRSLEQYRKDLRELIAAVEETRKPAVALAEPVNTFYPWMDQYAAYQEVFEAELRGRIPILEMATVLDCHERESGLRFETEGGTQKVVQYRGGEPRVLLQAEYQPEPNGATIAPEIYEYLDTHEVFMATFITDVHLNPEGHRVVAETLHQYFSATLRGQTPAAPKTEGCGWL